MIPEELKSGDRLEASWLNRLVRAIVARTLNVGPGLMKTQTPSGTTISLARQARLAGVSSPAGHPWHVSVSDSGGGSAAVSMADGYWARHAPPGQAGYGTVALPGSATLSGSGWVYAAIYAALNPQSYLWGAPTVAAAVGTSLPAVAAPSTSQELRVVVPVAEITRSGDAAGGYAWSVTQRLYGTLFFALDGHFARAVTGYAINYDTATGVLSRTPIYGVRPAADDAQQSAETVFAAVDEEI